MRGRPPKPTVLRVIEGNPGHRPILVDEPRPTPGIPTCPKTLKGEARREWRRISRELDHLGLVAKVDRAALASYCFAWARLLEAEQHLADEGGVVAGRQGGPVKNPWTTIQHQAAAQIKSFATEFGFTPSSRTRIAAPQRKKSLSEIAAERAAAVRRAGEKPT